MREVLFIAMAVLLAAMACEKAMGPPESIRYEDAGTYGTLVKEGLHKIAVYEILPNGMVGNPELWDKEFLSDDNPQMATNCFWCHGDHYYEPQTKRDWRDWESYKDFGQE